PAKALEGHTFRLEDVFLKLLADNGRHFSQLAPSESITIAITFRKPEPAKTMVIDKSKSMMLPGGGGGMMPPGGGGGGGLMPAGMGSGMPPLGGFGAMQPLGTGTDPLNPLLPAGSRPSALGSNTMAAIEALQHSGAIQQSTGAGAGSGPGLATDLEL